MEAAGRHDQGKVSMPPPPPPAAFCACPSTAESGDTPNFSTLGGLSTISPPRNTGILETPVSSVLGMPYLVSL